MALLSESSDFSTNHHHLSVQTAFNSLKVNYYILGLQKFASKFILKKLQSIKKRAPAQSNFYLRNVQQQRYQQKKLLQIQAIESQSKFRSDNFPRVYNKHIQSLILPLQISRDFFDTQESFFEDPDLFYYYSPVHNGALIVDRQEFERLREEDLEEEIDTLQQMDPPTSFKIPLLQKQGYQRRSLPPKVSDKMYDSLNYAFRNTEGKDPEFRNTQKTVQISPRMGMVLNPGYRYEYTISRSEMRANFRHHEQSQNRSSMMANDKFFNRKKDEMTKYTESFFFDKQLYANR